MRPTDWVSSADEPGGIQSDRLYIRSQIFQARIKAHDVVQEHLKQIVTVASATLALTVTFLKDILGNIGDKLQWSLLLPSSWVCLGVSILVSVLSLAVLVNNLDSAGKDPGRAFQAGGKRQVQIPVLMSFLSFGVGMLFLGLFAAKNFQGLLQYQKETYKVGSAVVAVEQARKDLATEANILRIPKVELISGIHGASSNLPVWHVQLEIRLEGATPPARSQTPAKITKGLSIVAPGAAPTQTIDYFVDALTGRLISPTTIRRTTP